MWSSSSGKSSTKNRKKVLGRFGTCTVKRDLPPANMSEMGDLAELNYSRSCLRRQRKVQYRERRRIGTLGSCFALPPQSALRLTESLPRVLLPWKYRRAWSCSSNCVV